LPPQFSVNPGSIDRYPRALQRQRHRGWRKRDYTLWILGKRKKEKKISMVMIIQEREMYSSARLLYCRKEEGMWV
jgi:hypothetical protein